jgi:signal transduction histidine kinase
MINMRDNFLHLDEDRILVEQLRLMMINARSTVIPVVLLIILLLWVLLNDSNALALKIWATAALISNLNGYRFTRRQLARGIPFEQAHKVVWTLLILNAIDGALWGGLTWVALDTSTLAGSILVMSVIAGMVGGCMSTQSPVLPVFIAFVTAVLIVVSTKILLMGDPAYAGLGVASVLYIAALYAQARNTSRSYRVAIVLQFKNIELLEQLRIEKKIAEEAQREAEQDNTAKSKFLAAASHDLRQPIHAQGLFLEVLSRTVLTDQQQELLTNARSASEASAEMLNTLLDFSRIEAGVIDPQILAFNLQPIFHKIENDLAPQADEKSIVYRTRDTLLAVQSDPVLLELILRNLVSNAIRYTNKGGVLVTCRRRTNNAVIEVWDTGVGIDPAQQQEVFREFHQLGNPERDRQNGLGLGLAIADGLARTLSHTLSLSSTPHRGSVFKLILPIANSSISSEETSTLQSRELLHKKRILFIDDDDIVREGMHLLLQDWGCTCDIAESIEEALVLAKAHAHDLIISDYRLREQHTGVEAIVAVHELLGEKIPAILITGDTAPDRLREAQASKLPLLHKPVSTNQLYRKMVETLECDK